MAGNYYSAHEYDDPSFNISSNFTSFQNQTSSSVHFMTNSPYYNQPSSNPQIPMVAFCPQSSSLSYNNSSASDEADENQTSIINERKQRRMISNRESARRSRMRKQKQLDELCVHVTWLKNENHGLMEKLKRLLETHEQVIQDNDRLKKETMELRQLLSLDGDHEEVCVPSCTTEHLRADQSTKHSSNLLH
ncbi:hypothetical protein L1987_62841 [Smallanthus sonchifolius]|uniref:Uncharacterized protein n=1 Tax=Smallanthus sonchifolius TaxID=185202 RepID=A0ACB9CBW7_9ASTR|nr:hypothetical protein L1987_62841 [Smallanthus sonchifolius]